MAASKAEARIRRIFVAGGALAALVALVAIIFFRPSNEWNADTAPPANVAPDHWTTGDKDAIGTAYGRQSNVWFTAVHGMLADLLYPTVDVDNLRDLRFLVTDGSSFLFDAATQGTATSRVGDDRALIYGMQVNGPSFVLATQIAADPERPVVVVSGNMQIANASNLKIYAYLVPHLGGTGSGQTAFFDGSRAYVNKKDTWLAIGGDIGSGDRTAGYLGHGDGYDQLHRDRLSNRYRQAGPGRVTLTWRVKNFWTIFLAFGQSRAAADAALDATMKKGAPAVFDAYRAGWRSYASQLSAFTGATPLFYHSAEVIKMAEDKLHPGAIVASLALPWGAAATDEDVDPGYRKVWPRDLYHAANGLLAAGDLDTAYDVLRFMGKQQLPDGSMPQNTDVEGRQVWKGQQLDETADAILLAARLVDKTTGPDVAKAADYIAANGPVTQQERWEEASGYSPATIAAEIAALRAAARLGGDHRSSWLSVAARWDAAVESWTFLQTEPGFGYYLRISPDGKPAFATLIDLANGGGVWDEGEIVDPSFLELARLGVREAHDPRIVDSLQLVDLNDSAAIAGVRLWYRYPHDGYGEKNEGGAPPGKGHLWPLLTGERGVYTVLAGGDARPYQAEMESLAGSEGLIGEQVWEGTDLPTGSARPLVWAQAEYIILAKAISTGSVDDRSS